jgi:anthranilate phosphoribosyltransferase
MHPVSAVQERSLAAQTMQWLLDTATNEEVVSFLTTRPIQAATASELIGYRDVLWQRRRIFNAHPAQLDIVGTGGVSFPRYNTSSTVAIVLAAMGIKVAKHGNRGSRQANGSFDFLEAIGLNLDALTHNAEPLLTEQNLAFLFARDWHPGFGKIAQARSQVPFPTAFNLLGPLLNPASPTGQIVGTPHLAIAEVLAGNYSG